MFKMKRDNMEIIQAKSSYLQPACNYPLVRSYIHGQALLFNSDGDFAKALADGFFLLEIPKSINLSAGLNLAHNFYKEKAGNGDDSYKGFKSHSIYFDREHFQTEHILADQTARAALFPADANELANEMNKIAILILRNVLQRIGIPEQDWDVITGGCLENKGTHWFACSHYRPEVNKQGCPTHQDTGFVTVLYIDQPGLEAMIDQRWEKIDPVPSYFVINFGRSFEILTEKMLQPVKSISHRVVKTEMIPGQQDRISFAAFTNMPNHLSLYQYDGQMRLQVYQSVEEFLTEFNKITWDDKYANFGLTS